MEQRLRNWCFTSYDLDNFKVPDDHADFRYCVYQAEKNPETGNIHFQGYIEFKKAMHFNTVKQLLNDNSVHLEGRRGTRAEARAYCMKPDTRYSDPMEFGTWTGGEERARTDLNEARVLIQQCNSWNEVLNKPELCNIIASKLNWARQVYEGRPMEMEAPDIQLREWQTQVLDMLDEEPVKRRVIWIWSAESGTGKTTFFDFCSARFNVLPGTDYTNTLYAYDGQRVIWFDLTRAQSAEYSPYHAIEKFSNCTFHLSTKYTSTRKLVKCHVVVTANSPPDETKLPNRCVIINATL